MARHWLRTVRLGQVKITREGEYARFDYQDPGAGGMNLKVGPRIRKMSDADLVRLHNEIVRNRQALRRTYKHVAAEIVGQPQIEYRKDAAVWTARGGVLRCLIGSDGESEPVIEIDDTRLTWKEFGELLLTHEGWGMRVIFVPEDELHKTPVIEVSAGKGRSHG